MSHSDTVQKYSSAWAQANDRDIREALAACWTPASTYSDPITQTVTGPEQLAAVILDFRANFPGAFIVPASQLDVHHSVGRFSWLLKSPAPLEVDGTAYGMEMDGFDYVEFSEDGSRILKIVGFFGPQRA